MKFVYSKKEQELAQQKNPWK